MCGEWDTSVASLSGSTSWDSASALRTTSNDSNWSSIGLPVRLCVLGVGRRFELLICI
jgi:hypothetical protein